MDSIYGKHVKTIKFHFRCFKMPYVLVRCNLDSYSTPSQSPDSSNRGFFNHRPNSPSAPIFKVSVAGLKGIFSYVYLKSDRINNVNSFILAKELNDLKNFSPGANTDNYTITFPQHPCVILNALEVLGFRIITSTTSHENIITWTLRKDFEDD